jgi:hypothetical protein
MIDLHHHIPVLIGLAVTVILGLGVGPLIRCVGNSLPLPPPSTTSADRWKYLTDQQTGGAWIGRVESPIFFAACWLGAWLLIASWLVFKLGFYWQSANFTAFPATAPDEKELDYLIAKRLLGTHHVATALVGTGANIVAALVGTAIGRWIVW